MPQEGIAIKVFRLMPTWTAGAAVQPQRVNKTNGWMFFFVSRLPWYIWEIGLVGASETTAAGDPKSRLQQQL